MGILRNRAHPLAGLMSELDRKLVRGSAWLALSYGGSQIVSLLIAAILAHYLRPSDFGLVALASVAIIALTTLQESGLSLAVIQRRTDVEAAAGTAFVFTATAGIALYGAAFVVRPFWRSCSRSLDSPTSSGCWDSSSSSAGWASYPGH